MSEEWQAFVKDSRPICKYGSSCYQKNPDHHKTYKHPPHSKKKTWNEKPNNKRFKPSLRTSDTTPEDVSRQNIDTSIEDTVHDESSITDKNTKLIISEPSTSIAESTQNDGHTKCTMKIPDKITYYDKTDHRIIKDLFLVEMPSDFFKFYEWLIEDGSEKLLASVNLELVGPYDLLLGKLPILGQKDLYLVHWRFFYDPPEFQAVMKKKGKSQYHIGYFRDDPEDTPVFVGHNDTAKGCHITPMAENIFGAVYLYLHNEKKNSPFTAMSCQKLMDKLKKWSEEHNFTLEEFSMKKRLAQIVTKTFHGVGIVVPYNKKTQLGYRKLVETDANLRRLFTKLESAKSPSEKDKILSELQPVITYANIAVDECDFGTGLEAGINLFCSGLEELQSSALSCLCAVYSLLKREAFSKIIQAHMKYRRKGSNMSLLSVNET